MAPRSGIIHLCGHTTAPRHEAVIAANDALNECGVILENLSEYSNRMTTYSFEIATPEVARDRPSPKCKPTPMTSSEPRCS
jgi:hypothetical protein